MLTLRCGGGEEFVGCFLTELCLSYIILALVYSFALLQIVVPAKGILIAILQIHVATIRRRKRSEKFVMWLASATRS